MPTATKFVAAVLYAAMAFVVTILAMPLIADTTPPANAPLINAALGALVGWFVAGPRAGVGWVEGISNGLTTTIAGLMFLIILHGGREMIEMSLRKRYSGPIEAIDGMVGFAIEYIVLLTVPHMILILVSSGALAGLLIEQVQRRTR